MKSQKTVDDQTLSYLQKILFYWAGANHQILAKEDCATERNKYASFGLTVLFTAIIASFSGGYAFFTIFRSLGISSIFGLFWGLGIIGNLDRLFILNLKKKQRRGWRKILGFVDILTTGVPRLGIAIILALVITKPLEIKFFDKEIESEIANNNALIVGERERAIRQNSRLAELQSGFERKNQEKNQNNERIAQARQAYNCEISGSSSEKCQQLGTSGKQGIGSIAQGLERNLNKLESEVVAESAKLDKELADIQAKLDNVEQDIQKDLAEIEAKQQNSDGLLMRLKTLESLGQKDPNIYNINLFVTLIFIMIEISPILVKIMSPYGIYDAALESHEKSLIYRYAESTEKDLELIDHEIEANFAIMKDIKNFEAENKKIIYIEMRGQVIQVILNQFNLMLQELLSERSEGLKSIRGKVLARIEKQIEQVLSNYSHEISISGREVNEKINQFQEGLLNEILSEQLRNSRTNAKLEDLQADIDDFRKQVNDFKEEDDQKNGKAGINEH
jgi:Domain of unknown function (DUF4407)